MPANYSYATVIFNAPLHHTCLMYGLRDSFKKLPSLNRKVINVGGCIKTIDNVVAPPPIIIRANGPLKEPIRGYVADVFYWQNQLSIAYCTDICSQEDISEFTEMVVLDYLRFRHPFTKFVIEACRVVNTTSAEVVAKISL